MAHIPGDPYFPPGWDGFNNNGWLDEEEDELEPNPQPQPAAEEIEVEPTVHGSEDDDMEVNPPAADDEPGSEESDASRGGPDAENPHHQVALRPPRWMQQLHIWGRELGEPYNFDMTAEHRNVARGSPADQALPLLVAKTAFIGSGHDALWRRMENVEAGVAATATRVARISDERETDTQAIGTIRQEVEVVKRRQVEYNRRSSDMRRQLSSFNARMNQFEQRAAEAEDRARAAEDRARAAEEESARLRSELAEALAERGGIDRSHRLT